MMSCETKIQVATWLKTFEEFTRGWVRLGCLDVDTQMTWMQCDYREIWVESRNAGVLFLSYQVLYVLVVGRYTNEGVLVASGAKEFFGTEGAVGLLTWFESTEFVLHITKYPAESQVEFTASMLQGRALTWWNTLVQTRGRAATIAQPWEDFKKLLME
ncbi:hypothetical protein Tco_1391801 [Tanacetum coccineum]